MSAITPQSSAPTSPPTLAVDATSADATGTQTQGGLASLLMGGLLVLTAPLMLIISILMAAFGPDGLHMSRSEVVLATIGFCVTFGLMLTVGVVGLVLGALSLMTARARRQPYTLPLAGLIVCALGLILCAFVYIDLGFVLVGWNRG
jgi:hypothetical protein